MGGGGGNQDSTSVTYTNLLPTYIPNVMDWTVKYLAQAADLSIGNFAAYTGQTYAVQNQNELDGISAGASRGLNGSPIEASGEAYLQNVYGGVYIGSNPTLDAAYQALIDDLMQQFTEDVLPNIRDGYAFSFGGSDHNIEEAKALEKAMDKITQFGRTIYYDDYARERKIQNAELDHVAPYGNRAARDAEMLRAAGVYSREWQQGQYIDLWNQWNENEILPIRNLDILGNAVRTVLGTTRTAAIKYYKPPAFAQIAGAAIAGTALLKMFSKTSKNHYVQGGQSDIDLKDKKEIDTSFLDRYRSDNSKYVGDMRFDTQSGKYALYDDSYNAAFNGDDSDSGQSNNTLGQFMGDSGEEG